MRKFGVFSTLLLVLILTIGCQNYVAYQKKTEKVNFEFNIPNAYTISEIDDYACEIYKGTEKIGGIVLTSLNDGKISDIDKTELRRYLDLFAPSPLSYEYVAMYCADDFDYVSIALEVWDPELQVARDYHHYLFEKAGCCYDLWLMDKLVDADEQNALLKSMR